MSMEYGFFNRNRCDEFNEKLKDILRPFMKSEYDLLVCSKRIIAAKEENEEKLLEYVSNMIDKNAGGTENGTV